MTSSNGLCTDRPQEDVPGDKGGGGRSGRNQGQSQLSGTRHGLARTARG